MLEVVIFVAPLPYTPRIALYNKTCPMAEAWQRLAELQAVSSDAVTGVVSEENFRVQSVYKAYKPLNMKTHAL